MCGVQTSSNLPAVIGFKGWLIAHKGNANSEPAICSSQTVKGTSRWAQGKLNSGWWAGKLKESAYLQVPQGNVKPQSCGGNCASDSWVYKGYWEQLPPSLHIKKAPKQTQPFG